MEKDLIICLDSDDYIGDETEHVITKEEARNLLEEKFGWFDKEMLDHYELKVRNEIEKGINVDENKETLNLIKILCAPSNNPLSGKRSSGNVKSDPSYLEYMSNKNNY